MRRYFSQPWWLPLHCFQTRIYYVGALFFFVFISCLLHQLYIFATQFDEPPSQMLSKRNCRHLADHSDIPLLSLWGVSMEHLFVWVVKRDTCYFVTYLRVLCCFWYVYVFQKLASLRKSIALRRFVKRRECFHLHLTWNWLFTDSLVSFLFHLCIGSIVEETPASWGVSYLQ